MRVKPKDRRQHEHRADHGVHEELHRGINFALVAKNSNQQRHRDQSGFPEEVKEKQIKRREHADQRRFHDQEQDEKFLHPVVNRIPGNQNAQRRKKCGQYHQPQRDAVDPHVVMDVGSQNPLPVDLKLKIGLSTMKVNRQMQRHHERQK